MYLPPGSCCCFRLNCGIDLTSKWCKNLVGCWSLLQVRLMQMTKHPHGSREREDATRHKYLLHFNRSCRHLFFLSSLLTAFYYFSVTHQCFDFCIYCLYKYPYFYLQYMMGKFLLPLEEGQFFLSLNSQISNSKTSIL